MTPETIDFLNFILDQVNISAGDPNFEVLSTNIVKARKELAIALTENHAFD